MEPGTERKILHDLIYMWNLPNKVEYTDIKLFQVGER
jgi:hypothetical protein